MSILSGFTINRKDVGQLVKNTGILNPDLNVHLMRPLQEIIYGYKYIQYFILSTPPGAGKSGSIKFPTRELLNENPNLKIVIAVPYLVLTKSFGNIILQYQDGRQLAWEIDLNLCDVINADSKVDELNSYLNRKSNLLSRVSIVSHKTLALLNEKYPDNKYTDIMFIIDEAHHVLFPDNDKDESANKIGGLIKTLFAQNDPTVKIWFLTATFFRGDRYSILPPEIVEQFVKYHLSLDEYWNNYLNHIKTFEYNFVIYKKIFDEVAEIFKIKGKRKTIIYCPYQGYALGRYNKYRFRDKIISAIKKVWPDCRILDLVQVEGRGEVKEVIINDSVEFDVVLAVKLFDEGTDWEQAESIIDLAPSNSLRIQIQRFGRLLRDYPGKEHIDYNVFFPYQANFKNEDDRRLHMSRCFNAFVASCLLHDAIEPVSYPSPPKLVKDETSPNKSNKDYVPSDPLSIAFPDTAIKQQAVINVSQELARLEGIRSLTAYEAEECIINSLKNLGVKDNFEQLALQIIKIIDLANKAKPPRNPDWVEQTVNVDFMIDAGFDKVWHDGILDGLLVFTTSFCGVKDFKEFREIYGKQMSLNEVMAILNMLAAKNNGRLPTISLISKMYPAIAKRMYKTPELFSHFIIEKGRLSYTDDEWREYALNLQKENGGVFPSMDSLKKDHGGLRSCIGKKPEIFEGILNRTRIRKPKSKKEWVKFAEELKIQQNGVFPSSKYLKKHHPGLANHLYKYPELFEHIRGKMPINNRPINNLIGWLKYGDELALKNNGFLPSYTELKENHSSFLIFMMKHKKHFSHFKKMSSRKSPNEWLEFYKDHISKHGGIKNLDRKTKNALQSSMRRNPELFK